MKHKTLTGYEAKEILDWSKNLAIWHTSYLKEQTSNNVFISRLGVLLIFICCVCGALYLDYRGLEKRESEVNLYLASESIKVKVVKINLCQGPHSSFDHTVVETEEGVRRRVRGLWGEIGDICKIPSSADWWE